MQAAPHTRELATPAARAAAARFRGMLADIPIALLQSILAHLTKQSLRAVASTSTVLLAEARRESGRALLGSHSDPPVQPDADGNCTRRSLLPCSTLLQGDARSLLLDVESDSECVVLVDGSICISSCAGSRLIRLSREGVLLSKLAFERSWPRALAADERNLYFTTMPADVNTELWENLKYPSSRVVRVPLTCLLQSAANSTAAPATECAELQWCGELASAEELEDDEWGEVGLGTEPGAPIALAVGAQHLFVLHRMMEVGARPWEFNDFEWDESPAWGGRGPDSAGRRKRALPEREHSISVFERGATRPSTVFSLGSHVRSRAPDGLAVCDGLVYVNYHSRISVHNAMGSTLRHFSLERPPARLLRYASEDVSATCFALANGRIYAQDAQSSVLAVYDLEGGLLQLRSVSASTSGADGTPLLSDNGWGSCIISGIGFVADGEQITYFSKMLYERSGLYQGGDSEDNDDEDDIEDNGEDDIEDGRPWQDAFVTMSTVPICQQPCKETSQ